MLSVIHPQKNNVTEAVSPEIKMKNDTRLKGFKNKNIAEKFLLQDSIDSYVCRG